MIIKDPTAWQQLTITVIADPHAGGPNMGVELVRRVVDGANELRSDLTVGRSAFAMGSIAQWLALRLRPHHRG